MKSLKIIAGGLAVSLMLTGTLPVLATTEVEPDTTISAVQTEPSVAADDYAAYLKEHEKAAFPDREIIVAGGDYLTAENAVVEVLDEFNGEANVLKWTNQEGSVTWQFEVEQAGLYCLDLLYHPLDGKQGKIELGLIINGDYPFAGSKNFTFHRRYKDVLSLDEPFETDNLGNQLSPDQEEVLCWMTQSFLDIEGYYTEPYSLYFTEGTNSITLKCLREPFVVGGLRLYQPEEAESYENQAPTASSGAPENYSLTIQAERATAKSDSAIRADYDKSSPITQPSDPVLTMRNIIGGDSWTTQNQWIEWEYEVPADGWYKLAMRYRQNAVRGMFTSRRLLIDGEVVYKELDAIRFNYGSQWQVMALGGDDPFLFYFEAGRTYTLRMEVTTGDMAPILRRLNDIQTDLNALYRKIIMVTGTSPDLNRDYQLEKEIPGLLDTMLTAAEDLEEEATRIEEATGFAGSEAELLLQVSEQLYTLVEEPYSIPERLSTFRENISGLASWIMDIKSQPLELDYLMIMAPETALPQAEASFFVKLWYDIQSFMASFVMDYNSVGTDAPDEECLEVWLGSGMEQMYILRRLVDRSFYRESGIPVKLKLVSSGLLTQAIMAGIGPDVALNVARTEPVNLAMRGALEPLDEYEGFEKIAARFTSQAFIPYRFYGHYYGLPETQAFNMMFVRTDIFEELGLEPPETWEDLYRLSTILQRNNMEVGIPSSVFNMLLLQNGGTYYNDTLTGMAFDTEAANNSFTQWVELYTQYGFSLFKDDYNRFRTGEMPLTIMSYGFYCQLMVAAPEIMGRWEMLPIPGVRLEDGSIDRSDAALAGACAIILKNSDKKEEAFRFLEWWSRDDVQTEYGLELENTIGPAARYTAANVQAFANMPWTTQELKMLQEQWSNVEEFAEVPGGYYISRNLDNAFRACVYRYENPREMLRYWTKETNEEIQRRLTEYRLGPQIVE